MSTDPKNKPLGPDIDAHLMPLSDVLLERSPLPPVLSRIVIEYVVSIAALTRMQPERYAQLAKETGVWISDSDLAAILRRAAPFIYGVDEWVELALTLPSLEEWAMGDYNHARAGLEFAIARCFNDHQHAKLFERQAAGFIAGVLAGSARRMNVILHGGCDVQRDEMMLVAIEVAHKFIAKAPITECFLLNGRHLALEGPTGTAAIQSIGPSWERESVSALGRVDVLVTTNVINSEILVRRILPVTVGRTFIVSIGGYVRVPTDAEVVKCMWANGHTTDDLKTIAVLDEFARQPSVPKRRRLRTPSPRLRDRSRSPGPYNTSDSDLEAD